MSSVFGSFDSSVTMTVAGSASLQVLTVVSSIGLLASRSIFSCTFLRAFTRSASRSCGVLGRSSPWVAPLGGRSHRSLGTYASWTTSGTSASRIPSRTRTEVSLEMSWSCSGLGLASSRMIRRAYRIVKMPQLWPSCCRGSPACSVTSKSLDR